MDINKSIESIKGYFDWEPLYDEIAENIPDRARFVEVGAYRGKSIIYLALKLRELGKLGNVTIDAIDNFSYEHDLMDIVSNLGKFNLVHNINIVEGNSRLIHNMYESEELYAAMIDGDHSYLGCLMDCINFWKKIQVDGYLLIHDYDNKEHCPYVKPAVDAFIRVIKQDDESCCNIDFFSKSDKEVTTVKIKKLKSSNGDKRTNKGRASKNEIKHRSGVNETGCTIGESQ